MTKIEMETGDWAIPQDLTEIANEAAQIIRRFCKSHDLQAGQRVFYSPDEWAARGEEYGTNSLLIVIHEASEAGIALSMDGAYEMNRGNYDLYEALRKELEKKHVYLEQATRWYSCLYLI